MRFASEPAKRRSHRSAARKSFRPFIMLPPGVVLGYILIELPIRGTNGLRNWRRDWRDSVIVIMVHWLIKKGIENEQAFEETWKKMTIQPNTGLYREVLTRPVEAEDPKFNTFSITDNAYTTYINIGIWKDLQSFDEAVGKYIQPPERRKPLCGPYQDREMLAVYRQDFEFKIRERVILKTILDRKGALEFPEPDLV